LPQKKKKLSFSSALSSVGKITLRGQAGVTFLMIFSRRWDKIRPDCKNKMEKEASKALSLKREKTPMAI